MKHLTTTLITLSLVALSLGACVPAPASPPAPIASPVAGSVAPAGEWQIYTNAEVGFSIKMPPTWSQQTLPDQNGGAIYGMAFTGPEGGVEVYWGVGFGGACPMGTEPVQLAQGEVPACHATSADGTETWSQIGYQVSGGNSFSVRAYTSDAQPSSHDLVLEVLSTLTFMPPAQPQAGVDPLPSWNPGPAKSTILKFVADVTDPAGLSYVPPADRIAVFDNDGTLWTEKPMPVQAAFVFTRIAQMAPDHPEWQTTQPYQAVLEKDFETLQSLSAEDVEKLVFATHAGMTKEEFEATAKAFLETAKHPRFGVLYTETVYQPMLELLAFLRANDFKTSIVSGGGVEFMRAFSEEVYGIPRENVVGSSLQYEFQQTPDGSALVRQPEMVSLDDRAMKPVNIQLHIGRRPILAGGNSDGDLEMLQYTGGDKGLFLNLLIVHDDAEREYDYLTGTDEVMAAAAQSPWMFVSMKRDFKTVFPAPAAIANPASQNCVNQGATLSIEARGDGGQFGVCYFADNRQCEEWALLRGECPVGGVKVTGYATPAARYCAITGGTYTITGKSGAEDEQGTCTFKDGSQCNAWDYYNGKCQASVAPTPTLAPTAAAGSTIQPLTMEVCDGQAQAMAHALDVLEVTQSEAPLGDPVTGATGTGCQATVTGTGEQFESPDAVVNALGSMLEDQDWTADPMLAAGGPNAIDLGYRKGDQICWAGAGWRPDASANCPKDQPVSACPVTPAQQVYTVTLNCGVEIPQGGATATAALPADSAVTVAITATQVITYTPGPPTGEPREGNCWTNSLAVWRADAWRCAVGNGIYDPCFSQVQSVICSTNPTTTTVSFLLTLTEPLPAPEASHDAANHAWLVELADGTVCEFATGATGGVSGERFNYLCPSPNPGQYAVILGDLQPGAVWMAKRAVVTDSMPNLTILESATVPVRTLWR